MRGGGREAKGQRESARAREDEITQVRVGVSGKRERAREREDEE